MSDFERALRETLRYEGGYVWHKDDPGGETNRGVTAGVYNTYRHAHKLPRQSVRYITEVELRDIYKTLYWDLVAPGRTWPLNAVLLDSSVNHGPNTALWLLDEVRHRVSPTDHYRMLKLALLVCDRRAGFYHFLVQRRPSLGIFLSGWLRRVHEQQLLARQPAGGFGLVSDGGLLQLPSPDLTTPRTPQDFPPTDAADSTWAPDPATLNGL